MKKNIHVDINIKEEVSKMVSDLMSNISQFKRNYDEYIIQYFKDNYDVEVKIIDDEIMIKPLKPVEYISIKFSTDEVKI